MSDIEQIVVFLKDNIGKIKCGSLRFFGEWFGRPMDNCHVVRDITFFTEEKNIVLTFDGRETLSVWNPADIRVDSNEFYIKHATKIRWEWYSYGNIKINENLYYKQYEKQGNEIKVTSGRNETIYNKERFISLNNQNAFEIC